MKKLKPIGYELINLKKEISNTSYSDTIKRALEISVDQMLEKGFIDLNTQMYIKDTSLSVKDFVNYLHEVETFKKSKEELAIEYEEFISNLSNEICNLGLNKDEFYCSIDLDNNRLKICKVFSLKAEFLKEFFYFEENSEDEYLDKLMKRKGFVEKFAILRLPRIFFNFIDSCDKNHHFELQKTYPYFDSKCNCYSIDLVFDIKIDKMEREDSKNKILNNILPIIDKANKYFDEKMNI